MSASTKQFCKEAIYRGSEWGEKKTKMHQISNSMFLFGGDSEGCCRQHKLNQEDLKLTLF